MKFTHGVIPNGWKKEKISSIGEVVSGATPKTSEPSYWDGSLVWVTPKDLSRLSSAYIDTSERKITDAGFESCSVTKIPANSLIMSSRAPIGYLAINKVPATTNQGCKSIIPRTNISTEYLYYYLTQNIDDVKRLGSGSTFAEVGKSAVESVEVLVPSIAEQKKIAEILFTVDDEIQKTDEIITATEKLKIGLTKSLFTKGIGHTSFTKTKIGTIPEDWDVVSLFDLAKDLDNQRVPITKGDRKSGEYPYYGASGIIDHVEQYIFDEDLLLISEDGANLKDRNYPIAFSVSGKCWVNNHAHVLRFGDINTQKFVECYLNSIDMSPYLTGTAQPKLNKEKMAQIAIPKPPKSEIDKIARMLTSIEEKIRIESSTKNALLRIKSGLSEDLLTGKVMVNI